MCGIAGLVNWSGEAPDPAVVRRMVGMIRHRGPDDTGVVMAGGAALGHARLAIIDAVGGRQPMSNEDGTLWITFNGEIFNYIELRAELEGHGHRFATRSDTEVILHAYEEWGERCVDAFNGQWAFGIWSARERRLFLSRDRVGIVPLFHTTAKGSFLFASEIKGLFCHPLVGRELDPRALAETLTFWAPLAPRTSFRNVFELPPGHTMTLTADSTSTARYWTPEYEPEESDGSDAQERAAELLDLLRDATRIRLRSDVPVGAYLSGGLDSTIVTTLIRQCSEAPLETFSVTFDDPEYDESAYQAQVVRFLGTRHHSFRCTSDDIAQAFADVVWHAETPLLRTAPAPLFLLAGRVRQSGYKVVLTGEGADEMLGGYDLFKEAKIRRFWAQRPDSPHRPRLLKRLYPYMPQLQAQPTAYLKAFFQVGADACASPFFSHLPRWNLTSSLKVLLADDLRHQICDYDPCAELLAKLPARYWQWDGFARAQYLETSLLLPGYILSSQGDRLAMAHGVEARFPFLDHRVIEFAGRLPARLKMRVLDEKYLLKQSVASLIPESVRRRKKQPYRAPESKAFMAPGAGRHDYVDELLSPARVRDAGVFAPNAVERLLHKVRASETVTTRDNMAFVGVLSTQLLVDRFLQHFTTTS
jgi:asparagine synthase (glutamine-hydrolysing)